MAGQAAGSARWAYVGAAFGQGLKDFATKLFTGRDAQYYEGNVLSTMNSFHGVGGKNYVSGREQGTTTYGTAKENMGKIGKGIGQKAAEKLINPSQKADQSMQKDFDKPDSGVDHLTKSPGS